jgi:DNA-binding NarL/FixJ family response regulator
MRRFIVSKLKAHSELQIVGELADGPEAIDKARELQPDLILMDIGLPTLNGIEAARRIQEVSPRSKILFVSENRSSDIAEEAFRSGGLGYVVKWDAEKDLLTAVETVLHGKRFVSTSLGGQFLVAATLTAAHSIHLFLTLTLVSGTA